MLHFFLFTVPIFMEKKIMAKGKEGAMDVLPERSTPATYQDVLDAPPNRVAEIIGGSLYTHPRLAMPHARAGSGLGALIGGPFDYGRSGPGGWWILDEPELHLADDILVPDLAGWRRTRMPEFPDTAYCELAPDWACEVLSPSTRALDRGAKQKIYAREGVGHLWFVDPDTQTLEVFELRENHWVLLKQLAGDTPVSLPPFDSISFPLGDLWTRSAVQSGSVAGS